MQDSIPSQTFQIWIFTRETDFASNGNLVFPEVFGRKGGQKLENCFVVVETTAILHNLSILWEDILPREMDHVLPPGMPLQHEEPEEGAPQNERRLDGERIRDGLKRLCSQTPPTAAELRKIRIRR